MQKFREYNCKAYVRLMVFLCVVPAVLALPIVSNGYECTGSWCQYDDPIGWVADCMTFQETANYPAPSGAVNPLIEEILDTLNTPNCDTKPSKTVTGPTITEFRHETLSHSASFTLQTNFSGKTGAELDFNLADSVGATADSEVGLALGTSTTTSWQWTTQNGLSVTHNPQQYTLAHGSRIYVKYTAKSKDGSFSGAGQVEWSVYEQPLVPPFTARLVTGTCEHVTSNASAGRAYVPGTYVEHNPVFTSANCPE